MEIPVYLFAGFLDSGKTNFINATLARGFALGDRTLLLCCEEGEEEYTPKYLLNVDVVKVAETEFTTTFLQQCEEQYQPRQIFVEYNGMWPLDQLSVLPDHWVLAQTITTVDARTFDTYSKNLGQLMMEKILKADMVIFHQCNEALRSLLRSRNLRMVNRRAEFFLVNEDGTSENYCTGDESPFDLNQAIIDVPEEDFGVWYVDVMEHTDRYLGKTVRLKAMLEYAPSDPDTPLLGRFAMVCCAEDIQFLGLLAEGRGLSCLHRRDYAEITACVDARCHPVYEQPEPGPVLRLVTCVPCAAPEQDVLSF